MRRDGSCEGEGAFARGWLPGLVIAIATLALALVVSGTSLADASKRSGQECRNAASQIGNADSIKRKAEDFWRGRLPIEASGLSVSQIRCGSLTGKPGLEVVVVLGLRRGTGSSPKPWGIYNRSRRGRFRLAHFDPGRKLICPSTPTIHRRVLTIYGISEYLGAHTLCDRIVQFEWRRGRYVQVANRLAFRRCQKAPRIPAEGGTFTMTRLRVSKTTCARAAALVARSSELHGWNCLFLESDREIRCVDKRNPRRWFAYVPS